MATIYYSKNIQNKINKGKKHIEQSPEETRYKFQKPSHIEVIWDKLKFPSNKLGEHIKLLSN